MHMGLRCTPHKPGLVQAWISSSERCRRQVIHVVGKIPARKLVSLNRRDTSGRQCLRWELNGTTHDLEWTNTLVTNVGGEKRTHRRNGLTRSIIEYRHHRGVACQAWAAVFDQPNEPGTNEDLDLVSEQGRIFGELRFIVFERGGSVAGHHLQVWPRKNEFAPAPLLDQR